MRECCITTKLGVYRFTHWWDLPLDPTSCLICLFFYFVVMGPQVFRVNYGGNKTSNVMSPYVDVRLTKRLTFNTGPLAPMLTVSP